MNPFIKQIENRTRRYFLRDGALGLGAIAASSLLADKKSVAAAPEHGKPHFVPRAKRVIYLHMTGSPPNLDLFDYKPELIKRNGEDCPASFLEGREFAFTSGVPKLLGTPQPFVQAGKGGTWMSAAIPNLQRVADEMCVIHSMHTDQFNHAPAELLIYTGSPRSGRPSMGSWVTYGLGSENEDLPAFVVLISSGVHPSGGKS